MTLELYPKCEDSNTLTMTLNKGYEVLINDQFSTDCVLKVKSGKAILTVTIIGEDQP